METVYIDLLVIINLYITYFLLKGTGVFLHRKLSTARCAAGAFAGGVSSIAILLPPLPFFANIVIKAASGAVITLIAFGRKDFLKNALFFIIINVVFAGLTLLLWLFAAPFGMTYRNGFAYFDISFAALAVTTAISYGLIKLLRYLLDTRISEREYKIEIINRGQTVTLPALADSGNMLVDFFTGMSVIVCGEDAVKSVFPEAVYELGENGNYPDGIRFLPYTTVSSAGLIPVFKAEKISVKTEGRPDKAVRALIGVTKEKIDGVAIFNPKIII